MTTPSAVRLADLRRVLDELPGRRVLVVGDVLLDDYLTASGTRMAREAPVPAVTVGAHDGVPGGAGNLAANLAGLGAQVRLVGVTGDDADGERLRAALVARGVDISDLVVEPGRATVAKRRVVADGQVVFRFDEGSTAPVAPSVSDALSRRLAAQLTGPACPDVVMVSDYGGGTVTAKVLACLVRLVGAAPDGAQPATRCPRLPVVVDAHDLTRFAPLRPTLVTPNAAEAAVLLGRDLGADTEQRVASVREECARLHATTGARTVAVTLDRDGTVVCDAGAAPYRTYATPAPDRFACGAGDTYASAFALALAADAPVTVAAELAQAAAAVVTRRDGTTQCSLAELRAEVGLAEVPRADGDGGTTAAGPPASLDEVVAAVAAHRAAGRRVVLTNGCFDLLHRGHVDLLARAKALGDVLVVALNDDDGVRGLKGPGRPVNPLADRAQVLAALSCVDHVVAFAEPTATAVVEALRPDVFVKGDDHHDLDAVPEVAAVRACGGQVRLLPCAGEGSTSSLIERIVDGAGPARRADGDLSLAQAG